MHPPILSIHLFNKNASSVFVNLCARSYGYLIIQTHIMVPGLKYHFLPEVFLGHFKKYHNLYSLLTFICITHMAFFAFSHQGNFSSNNISLVLIDIRTILERIFPKQTFQAHNLNFCHSQCCQSKNCTRQN